MPSVIGKNMARGSLEVVTGKKVRLENYEYYIADRERLERHLVDLAPGLRETIAAEKVRN